MVVLEQYESFKQISYGAGPFVYFASEINTTCMGPMGREVLLQLDVRTSVTVFEQQLEMFVSP